MLNSPKQHEVALLVGSPQARHRLMVYVSAYMGLRAGEVEATRKAQGRFCLAPSIWSMAVHPQERPSAETLYRIARALGTSMSELMGRSVLVDQAEELPQALIEFAEDEGLGERDKAMLAQINFRGKQPERPEDWAFIWHAIRRSIPESERKRPSAKKKSR